MMNGLQSLTELAFAPIEEIVRQQEMLLRQQVAYVANASPWYREQFRQLTLDPNRIRTLDDLLQLPCTRKQDIEGREQDFVCQPDSGLVDVCLTSGTTSEPVPFFQSELDLQRLALNEELTFRAAGICQQDRVVIAAAIDRCFMAGLAYFLGLRRIGATAIRGGSSSVAVVAQLIRRFRPTAIVGVPTLMLALARRLEEEGIDPRRCGVKKLICIGEPVRQASLELSILGVRLQDSWQAQVFGTYASTEMATTFGDCLHQCGGHLHPQLIHIELLDDEERPVADGTPGEVVATPLQVTGMPLLRFKTGDIATLHRQPCACGRNSWRLGPILGRKDHRLKVRGTTLFPSMIFSALQELEEVVASYVEVYDDYALCDRIRVVVACRGEQPVACTIADHLCARLRITPEVVIQDVATVQKTMIREDKRKPVQLFDYRERSRLA
ncbi:MAG: AMP-binding protein [Desulfuromonadaceae bacterium]|nr:AMP-binding protein [Desulfuromonadaceae bacterium]